ncbi:MAG: signal peptidase [Clostridiales bacterium]|nr:signal peptidase [Clostridiales bacterium]
MKRAIKFTVLNILLIFFDQFTKHLAKNKLMGNDGWDLIPGVFKLQYLENRGAAFGMFQNQLLFLIPVTIIIFLGIIYIYGRIPREKRFLPLEYLCIFISAGAIGNFIDRVLNNYVVDFLYFELINFPIFNVADCYVTISAVLLLVLGLFYYKEEDFQFLVKKKSMK